MVMMITVVFLMTKITMITSSPPPLVLNKEQFSNGYGRPAQSHILPHIHLALKRTYTKCKFRLEWTCIRHQLNELNRNCAFRYSGYIEKKIVVSDVKMEQKRRIHNCDIMKVQGQYRDHLVAHSAHSAETSFPRILTFRDKKCHILTFHDKTVFNTVNAY